MGYSFVTAVVPPDSGRGSEHQELQEPAVADAADLQLPEKAPADRHSSPEQPHGAVVAHALPHAARLPKVGYAFACSSVSLPSTQKARTVCLM